MRTVYLGTSRFAAVVLERLAASAHAPALVVTRPDRPRGRGRRVESTPVARHARQHDLPLAAPERIDDPGAVARIEAAEPEALVVCAFGALIREPLLSAHEIVNVHPSLLPRWRGAAPIERAIEAGDEQTGVSIMRLVAELDAGPVFSTRAVPIDPADDWGSLSERLARLGADLLVETLDALPEPVAQAAEGVTYAEKVDREERLLDPLRGAEELARRVRALSPHVGTWTDAGGERLGVTRAHALGGGPAAGELVADGERLLLGCADGALDLVEVKPPGGRAMPAADYLRGRRAAQHG